MTPPTVNILGLTYTVERVPYVSKDDYSFGDIDFEEQRIRIDCDLSAERFRVTLLHEIIHGILEELKFHSETQNETLVNGLAVGLSQSLRSAPSLFGFNITATQKGAKVNKKTSPKVASKAAKALRDGRTGKLTKTFAATAVSQAGGKTSKRKK